MIVPDAPPVDEVDILLVDGEQPMIDLANSISSLESEQEVEIIHDLSIAGRDSDSEVSVLVEDQRDGEADVELAVSDDAHDDGASVHVGNQRGLTIGFTSLTHFSNMK